MNHLLVDYLTISFKFTDELKTFILSGLDEKVVKTTKKNTTTDK